MLQISSSLNQLYHDPCCSVAKDCSMPGSSVLHCVREFAQIHVHWVSDAILTISFYAIRSSFCLQSFPASGAFPLSWLFTWGGQRIGASGAASVLPMNIQDWFPLGLTGLISLQSKKLSRVFSSTTIRKHQLWSLLNPKFSALKTDCLVSINIVTLHFFLFEVKVILTLVSNKLSFLLIMNCFGDFKKVSAWWLHQILFWITILLKNSGTYYFVFLRVT